MKAASGIDIFSTSRIFSFISNLIRFFHLIFPALFLIIIATLFKFYSLSFYLTLFFIFLYLSYRRPVYALALLIFSVPLTPKMNLGVVSFNLIDIKIEDILVFALCLSTIGNYSQGKLKLKPMTTLIPFLFFICIGAISLLKGIFVHSVGKPVMALLVMFKWIEYSAIFYLGYLYIENRKSLALILTALLFSGFFVCLYGWWEFMHPKWKILYHYYYRLFDRGLYLGQNNHMAGFLVLWFCIIAGLFISARDFKYKILLGFAGLVGILPFLATYSRKSYLALIFAFLTLTLLTGKKKYFAVSLIILLVIAYFFGIRIIDRFRDIKDFFLLSDPFTSQRFYILRPWKISLKTLENYPLIGAGFGSRHRLFYESQWIMIAAETGILGLISFSYVLLIILKNSILQYRIASGWLRKGFYLGFIAAFLGILVHGITCVSFVVTLIGVPFWLFAGIASQSPTRET